MTDIKEIPVDPPEAIEQETMENENNTEIVEENIDIPKPKTPVVKKNLK